MVEATPLGLCVYLALVGPRVRQPGVRDSKAEAGYQSIYSILVSPEVPLVGARRVGGEELETVGVGMFAHG